MELDELKKTSVERVISSIGGGIAYCHFVEYNFKKSLEEPNLKPVNYRIFSPKVYEDAKQLWIEGLTSLKEHDLSLSTNLFDKNFTEELYFCGNKRISLHIKGQVVSSLTSSKKMELVVAKSSTPSNYEYYDIEFRVTTPVKTTYSVVNKTGNVSGVHKKFMEEVKLDLGVMSKILSFGKNDFVDFDNEVTRSFAKFPDLQSSKDAIKMAILFTWPTTNNPQKTYVALIPPAFEIPQKVGKKQITAGGVALFTNNYLSLSPLLFDCLQNWVSIHTTKQLVDYSRNEAIKSAKAAIMSRNMSHNLGSHVMSYLKQKLGSITSILNESNKVLYNLIEGEKLNKTLLDETNKNKSDIEKIKENVQLPFLVGTGRFIGYLQERQDYIATIATDYIPYGAPVNLKDAVYDELNPDLRYMRHNAEDNNRPMNILLNYIAKSEGFSRENMGSELNKEISEVKDQDIHNGESDDKLKYRTKNDILFGYTKFWREEVDGKLINMHDTFGLNESTQNSDHPAMAEMRGVNFSMPGGLVGRQALFSIIENLIRNAAKHGDTSGVSNLIFTFDTIPLYEFDRCISIEERICDEKWKVLYENASDKENLYIFTITDNLKYDNTNNKVLGMLMKGLYEPYVDNSGNMTTGNKGIKEIRISSAWLRNDTDEDNYYHYGDNIQPNSTKKKAPLVAIELTADKHLRYMICLMRDRFAAVVTEEMNDLNRFFDLQKLSPKEWNFYESIDEIKADYKISYRYIFVANKDVYNKLRPYTSNRLVIWNLEQEEVNSLDAKWNIINADESNHEKKYRKKKNLILEYLYYDILKASIPEETNENVFEPIYIWDGTAKEVQKDVYDLMIKLCSNDTTKGSAGVDGSEEARYVYRTHHSSEKDFMSYWKEKCLNGKYKSIKRIDAVTGDNSSDRLIRREKLDEEWYYTHLNALRKKVVIFDERIFKIVHSIDETDFVIKNPSLDYVEKILTKLNSSNEEFYAIKQAILDNEVLPGSILEEVEFIDNKQELQGFLSTLLVTFKHIYADNYKSIVYNERGIDILTIIEERKGCFAIVGYVGKPDEVSDMVSISSCKYDKIANMSCEKNGNQFNVRIVFEDKYKNLFANRFDYISIHQGLLDKLYEGFGIKAANEKNNPNKGKVTQKLFDQFSRSTSKIGSFLPNFVIHSGRAKPTKDDMPQELPFIQYAAIENAVNDCKFALVELLDYARFDPSDN